MQIINCLVFIVVGKDTAKTVENHVESCSISYIVGKHKTLQHPCNKFNIYLLTLTKPLHLAALSTMNLSIIDQFST